MKTFTSLEQINSEKKYFSLAIGNFDGVHEGHKLLLAETVSDAIGNNGLSGVFTFWSHPIKTLKPDVPFKLLSSLERKKELIAQAGIDNALFIPFTKEIMELSPEEFVKKILLDTLNVASVHVGYNFTFGRRAEGTINDLKYFAHKYGFNVMMLPEVNIDGNTVSSTLIRQCIEDGEIQLANKLLGYNYTIDGKVVAGDKRGREIGYPTANILVDEEIIIPARGVYAAYVTFEEKVYKAVLNIGNKPTFGNNTEITFEVHLLEFEGDLYGKILSVEFIKRLRGEQKFDSIEKLIQEIKNDVKAALKVL